MPFSVHFSCIFHVSFQHLSLNRYHRMKSQGTFQNASCHIKCYMMSWHDVKNMSYGQSLSNKSGPQQFHPLIWNLTSLKNKKIENQVRNIFHIFSYGATLYPPLPLCVCLSVCLIFVPRFVCPLLLTTTKAWTTPGSDQQYSGVQTDDQATFLEQKRIPHKLRGFLSATLFSMNIFIFNKRRDRGVMSIK
jgi:hypothetical protein